MADARNGRIAIKLGSAPSKSTRPAPSPVTLDKRRRRGGALGVESDSEPDQHDDGRGNHAEAITGFGADGAEMKHRRQPAAKKKYVIARQANRNWKTEVKARRRQVLSEEARRNGSLTETEPADQDKGLQWGLITAEKKPDDEEKTQSSQSKPEHPKRASPRTADEEAMDSLLGLKTDPQRIIQSEDDMYKRDVAAAGVASTLEDYEAMPVEEFGAALLRGMGWNGEYSGPKRKEVQPRQNPLGLGAGSSRPRHR